MNQLPYEILEMIMLQIPPEELAEICCIDRNFAEIGRDLIFRRRYSDQWLLEIRSYYSPDNGLFVAGMIDSPPLIKYFLERGGRIEKLTAGAAVTKNYQLVDDSIKLFTQSTQMINNPYLSPIQETLNYYGYRCQDRELLKKSSNFYLSDFCLENRILASAANGEIDSVLLMIQSIQTLDFTFFMKIIEELVKGSYLNQIDILWEKFNSFRLEIYQIALGYACQYGNIDLVESLLERNNTNLHIPIIRAAFKGDYNLLDHFLTQSDSPQVRQSYISYTTSEIFKQIIKESKLEESQGKKFLHSKISEKCRMFDYLIQMGNLDRNIYMLDAIRLGSLSMVKYCISKGSNQITDALYIAVYHNQLPIVKYLIEIRDLNLNPALKIATKRGHLELIDFLIEKGATNIKDCFYNCAYNGKVSSMIYLMNKFPVDTEVYNHSLIEATTGNQEKAVKFLISRGATNIEQASCYAIHLNLFSLFVFFSSYLLKDKSFELVSHLLFASKYHRLDMIRYLMFEGGKNRITPEEVDILIQLSEDSEIKNYFQSIYHNSSPS